MNLFIFSLLSVFASVVSIYLIIKIFRKIYEDEYKRPWLFIGFCALFLAFSEVLNFLSNFNINLFSNIESSKTASNMFVVISNMLLAYGILLEFYILKYFKSKSLRLKFIPTTEGNLDGSIDLNVDIGESYICFNDRKKQSLEEISRSLKKSFQGFFLTEENIEYFREKYKILKSPICYIYEVKDIETKNDLLDSFGANTDIADPLELNNILVFVENFLERAKKPIIIMDLNLIYQKNNYSISSDFVLFLSKKIKKFNAIGIFFIDEDKFEKPLIDEIKINLKELE